MLKERWNKCLRERIAALRGTRNLAVLNVLSRFLRSVRLALHLAQQLFPFSFQKMRHCWHLIKQLSGDSAYEQYLQHHADFHISSIDAPAALTRKQFYKYWQESKWTGVNRCC